MIRSGVIGITLVLSVAAHAGDNTHLTGNVRIDFFGVQSLAPEPWLGQREAGEPETPTKSPWLAGGLSLVVPGAGEVYAGTYLKAAIFFAAEVALWAVAATYDKKGDRKTAEFESFADAHWSVARYARWTLDNAATINPNIIPDNYAVFDGAGNVNWVELNRLERDLGGWYSHTLPPYGDQQYYELIGKYQQYYQGWDDGDPTLTTYEAISAYLRSNPDSRFQAYARERGRANDFYNTASAAITVVIINHVLSAADAAWSAGRYNKFHAEVGSQRIPYGQGVVQVPAAKLSYSF